MLIALLVCIGLLVASFLIIGLTMKLLWMVLIGFIVGALAKGIMSGKDDISFGMTILLGLGGSMAGSILARILSIQGGAIIGFVFSIIGAVALLGGYRLLVKSD